MCGGQGLRFNAYATVYRFSAALKIGNEADLPQNEDEVLDETYTTSLDGASREFSESASSIYVVSE